ncbi:MAG: choice-of-anchor D domain-containing protein [Archangium sp.]|nr:choice-of-anchor D domain-containing protein [Archangium sp.]
MFLFTACACPSPPAPFDGGADADAGPVLQGELAIEWVDANGGTHVDRHASRDFGATLDGVSVASTVRVKNLGTGPLTLASVERLSGDAVFRLSFAAGLQVPAGESADLSAFFEPTLAGVPLKAWRAQLRVSASGTADGTATALLDLSGATTDGALTWAPATLDFGYSPPSLTSSRELVFSNRSLTPVRLSALATNPSTVFSVVATDSSDLTTLTVPAAVRDLSAPDGIVPGVATARLGFRPVVLGPRAGQLTATTGLPGQPTISVDLRGVGGGPDLDARPTPVLDFGRVAFFPGSTPASFGVRPLTVQNVGVRPTPPDPRANLKLGQPDGAGGFRRPYWEVSPLAGASLTEICVGAFDALTSTCTNDLPPGSYDPAVGLEAGGTSSTLSIPVRITPNGLGTRSFELRIFSNDADEPATLITVTANAVMLPPCDVEIAPVSLTFGLLAPPASRELGFTIRNRLSGPNDVCLLSNLQLSETGTPAGMPPVFSLVGAPFLSLDLQPGQSKQIGVRAWPQGQLPASPAQVAGKVSFNLARPGSPVAEVPLTAAIGRPCLTIFPAQFDFGTVATGCGSADRTFQLYNTCTANVVIDASSVSPLAGEFGVATGVAPGTQVSPGAAPITFSLRYRPLDVAADLGAFRLHVTEGGLQQDYVIPLKGTGDLLGINTQTIVGSTRPKADVLLVLDDSCSMAPRHAALVQQLAALFQGAATNQLDLQLGVTNTELSGPTAALAGTLHSTDAGVKILRSTTPNLQAALAELVNVGTSGSVESCLEPATRALTAPNITDPAKNAGFLRDDATLGVLCLTDARDQATAPPAVYLNQLLNIKGAQRAGQFTYSVIGPFLPMAPAGCVYDDPNDGVHDFMVTQTGGAKAEICSTDWAPALESLLGGALGPRTDYALTARPDLASPIGVEVDGMAVPQVDPGLMTPIWHYDLVSNSIIFEPRYAPEPGKTLTITYRVPCMP